MKTITLTQGKVALVDDKDFEALNKFKWYAVKGVNTFYARRKIPLKNGKQTGIYIHSVLVQTPKGMETDHIDGDGLNNQRKNLRVCTRSENQHNRSKTKNNTSGLKGVSWYKESKKWRAHIMVNGKNIHLGYFDDKLLAYKAYCNACMKYHGKFANVK